MHQYQEEYKRKLITMDEFLDLIPDGDIIATSQCAAEPTGVFDNLHRLYGVRHGIRMYAPMCFREHEFLSDPKYADTFDIDLTFLMGATRRNRDAGALSYYPGDLHNAPARWIMENGCKTFIAAVTPMDSHGYFLMPLCLIHERAFMEAADRIIVEVNPNLPRVYGDTEIHISQIDHILEYPSTPPYLPESRPNDIEKAIGGYVATLIGDGDTIQLGIGGVPDAAAMALMDKRDLGVHSEMITNAMVDLVEAGVINGSKKSLHRGKIVGTFAYGTQRLYDMLNDNPAVLLLRGDYVNDPWVVAKNDNFVSVNSCLGVDLTDQVCSESIGSRQYSGSGGQVDMAIGAAHAKNGRNIIAVASTKKQGTISSITAQLAPGSVVTLSRNEVDYVVTEYGIAKLRGMSVRKRVANLIAVAHPDFRAELKKDAERLRLW